MAEEKQDTTQKRRVSYPCPFCEMEKTPNYKDYKTLSKYISDRAKILGRSRTGVCSTHQRALSISIKRARFLGLLPYTPSSTG